MHARLLSLALLLVAVPSNCGTGTAQQQQQQQQQLEQRRQHHAAAHTWLTDATRRIMNESRLPSTNPNTSDWMMFSPNAQKHYRGQWMRDGFYGLSNAWELVGHGEAVRSIRYMLDNVRPADGAYPQQVSPAGARMFGQEGANLTLDSAPFAARTAGLVVDKTGNLTFFEHYAPALARGLRAMTLSPRGLVYNNGVTIGYGFHDSVLKSGEVLYTSLLYYDACMTMSRCLNATLQHAHLPLPRQQAAQALSQEMLARATAVQRSLTPAFWNSTGDGMFHAAVR
jgi:hypothetical protein